MSELDDKRTSGVVAVWIGVLTLLVSLSADLLGIGNLAEYGSYQLWGAVLGSAVMVVGLFLTLGS